MMWKECEDTAIHPSSEARATRGWKMNREVVNCVALTPSQDNLQRDVRFALTQRGRTLKASGGLPPAGQEMGRGRGGGAETTPETGKRGR